jgi:hypothetical protein
VQAAAVREAVGQSRLRIHAVRAAVRKFGDEAVLRVLGAARALAVGTDTAHQRPARGPRERAFDTAGQHAILELPLRLAFVRLAMDVLLNVPRTAHGEPRRQPPSAFDGGADGVVIVVTPE